MGPRGFTLPAAQTQSAKAARSAFFCTLCQKGYSRMNEFDAHESSYDHQHKKRLKEMKEMQRQVQSTATTKKEEKGGPLMQIKLGGTPKSAGGGFRKGGFKSAFGEEEVKKEEGDDEVKVAMGEKVESGMEEVVDSDVTDDEDYYDPRRPTGCGPGCASKTVGAF